MENVGDDVNCLGKRQGILIGAMTEVFRKAGNGDLDDEDHVSTVGISRLMVQRFTTKDDQIGQREVHLVEPDGILATDEQSGWEPP